MGAAGASRRGDGWDAPAVDRRRNRTARLPCDQGEAHGLPETWVETGLRPVVLDPSPQAPRRSARECRESLTLGVVVALCYSLESGGVSMTETRKIAAILAADVVGFSRLTSADEDRTLARLRSLRAELIDPTVASQNGRVFKRTGDGALVEFRSVVEAVRCAIAIQNAMIERNVGISADQRIEFRIGIHLGDVVEESDGDLMGDGVNIAARLEGIAKPGAICLSEQAYWQVKARLDIAVSDLGSTQLKNIAEPVHAFSLQVGLPAQVKPAGQAGPTPAERSDGAAVLAGQTVDRRSAVPEHERRRRAGFFL